MREVTIFEGFKVSIYIPPHVKVIVEDLNGEVRHSQLLSEYLQKPSLQLQLATYGHTLLDILIEESYVSPDLVLRQVLTNNPHADATRLIGSIAESLVVKMCNEYPEINRILGMHARFGTRLSKKLDEYVAVATGSMRTKQNFFQYYNPSDTQRDIIWVDKNDTEDQLLCIKESSSASGKPAGLQVKASHDGINYVLPAVQNYHYPILYFDLNDDWIYVRNAAMDRYPACIFIHPDEVFYQIKHILKGYFAIIIAIIRGETSLQRVAEEAKYNGDSALTAGLDAAEPVLDSVIILPPHI
ncbi:hypothetical protein AWB76_07552 [Caballeronia temeraria]|uniref:Uncharacterized protein n=1 Tax=Caballeronia temeraria TaxID=1777137 RepID=A0A158DXY1_9BURK|nr:hypothetical protein [Caballeronia temeraria]SAK98577.1 hypothetical protein AWB76_07552 [Caballeronia temeraria]